MSMPTNNLNWSLEYYEEHTNECNNILDSLDSYDNIPLLDYKSLQTLTDGALVRYQGMIQDMLNPEYYSGNFTVINKDNNETCVKSGKFRDIASCKGNEELNFRDSDFVPKERQLYFCIPIPGTNDWVFDYKKESSHSIKNEQPSTSSKRRMEEDETMEVDTEETTETMTKKTKSAPQPAPSGGHNINDNDKYFPIPKQNNLPCIIKIYEDEDKTDLVLNDTIEIIGFLSLNPALEANWDDTDAEDRALNPPPSLVPRIHVVKLRKLKHCNPLLKQIIPNDNIQQLAESARSDLHLILTQIFFEDTLAADYVICNLISKIYVRSDSQTLGKFSLNLFNISSENFGFEFYQVLKSLVTNSHYLPLSTGLLNEQSFIPKKDYETNRLWSGVLQLSNNIHLVIDETKMNEGQLDNTGCLNVAALQKLLRYQETDYDFIYYPVKYLTDLPVIVISEGKSMFETDVRLKVKYENLTENNISESFKAVKQYLNNEVLNKIRVYLTSTRLLQFDINEEMMKKIGDDYVTLREADKEVNYSDLNTLLILSRLVALSYGKTTLELEHWNQAMKMEKERKFRLK